MTAHPTLADIQDELRRGGAAQGDVRTDGYHLDGACLESGVVIVNPMPAYVHAAIHELLHRMHPRWRHARIERECRRLMRQMTSDDLAKFYRAYKRRARTLTRPVTIQAINAD